MQRDLDVLSARYDLVVVGAGIHGLFAAYDAASRGLSVVVVERDDVGGGLSFNHQRTITGGLEHVAAGRVGLARRCMVERRAWARMAPHLVRPLPFLAATYRFTRRSRWRARARFALYDFLGRKRNTGIPSELHLPKSRLESVAATRRLFRGVDLQGLSGGAVWYEYQTESADRLNWTVALAAVAAGARLVTCAEALQALTESGRVVGVRVRDRLAAREYDLSSTATLLAVGDRLPQVLVAFGADGAPPMARAMSLLLDRPAIDMATVALTPTGRKLTVVPWRGRALVGPSLSVRPVTEWENEPPAGAIDEMLAEVGANFPALQVNRSAIRMVHHGLVPIVTRGGRIEPRHEPVVRRFDAAPGVFSLSGISFATARLAAEMAVDAVCRSANFKARPCRTARVPLPHADIADAEGRLVETLRATSVTLDRDITTHLTSWYGTEAPAVVEHSVRHGLLDRLPDSRMLSGEIAYAVEHASAVHLADAVMRRTPLGSAGHPGKGALNRAAEVMGGLLAWTDDRRAEEIGLVEARYRWN